MIVACTGHTEDEFVLKAFRHEMDEVLSKPVSIHAVSKILYDVIETSE